MEQILLKLRDKFGVHPCGEGGGEGVDYIQLITFCMQNMRHL